MVHRIRVRGHVIRILYLRPTTSRIPPESCPSCFRFYNDGKHRRCVYLCCEFEDCLDCVLNRNIFSCTELMDQQKAPQITPILQPEVVTIDSDLETDPDEHNMTHLKSNHKTQSKTDISETVNPEPNLTVPEIPFAVLSNENPTDNLPIEDTVIEMDSYSQPIQESALLEKSSRTNALQALVQQIIPKHHWQPLVRVKILDIQQHRKRRMRKVDMLTSIRRSGRTRMCQTA